MVMQRDSPQSSRVPNGTEDAMACEVRTRQPTGGPVLQRLRRDAGRPAAEGRRQGRRAHDRHDPVCLARRRAATSHGRYEPQLTDTLRRVQAGREEFGEAQARTAGTSGMGLPSAAGTPQNGTPMRSPAPARRRPRMCSASSDTPRSSFRWRPAGVSGSRWETRRSSTALIPKVAASGSSRGSRRS